MTANFFYTLALMGTLTWGFAEAGQAQGSTEYMGRLGLYGSDFTATSDGYQSSTPEIYRAPGFVAGTSERFFGDNMAGQGLWAAKISSGLSYRIGLYQEPEFTGANGYQRSTLVNLSQSGYAIGSSNRYDGSTDMGQAAWTANASTGSTIRIGYGSSNYTRADGYQFSEAQSLTNSGYISGYSNRYSGSAATGKAAWIANAETGSMLRVGYFSSPEFVRSSDSYQYSSISQLLQSGHMVGVSTRFNGDESAGIAMWVAHAATGTPTRIGLFSSPEFTSTTDYQETLLHSTTESGFINGYSRRYSGSSTNGIGAWMADVSTGTTYRIGLFSGPEFTRASDSYQYSSFFPSSALPGTKVITEAGLTFGHSNRYDGNNDAGAAGWVASATTGITSRVGLYSGSEFTRSTNSYQSTQVLAVTESGYIHGQSNRYNGTASVGVAAWVANASTGMTHRVGLYSAPEFTGVNNLQASLVTQLTESGFAIGYSTRYFEFSGTSYQNGQGVWAANGSTGVTHRIGLYNGTEFTSTSLSTQNSEAVSITESGYVSGYSDRYNGNTANGRAAWVAQATTGETTRVGFYGNSEFTRSSDSYEYSNASILTESGYALGSSNRYNGTTATGTAAWIADVSTGTTTRLGFYQGAEFTRASDSSQESSAAGIKSDNFIYGTSKRYNGSANAGTATWVANISAGTTTRIGLTDTIHTSSNGIQSSSFNTTYLLPDRYLTGKSTRYNGDTSADGQTAWIFDLTLNSQVNFELSVRASDGYAWSDIQGITESGIAYGIFSLFDGSETDLGYRAFVWSEETGTLILDESVSGAIGPEGWDYLKVVDFVTEDGFVIAIGPPEGVYEASEGVYVLRVVPEPNIATLIVLAASTIWLRCRRKPLRPITLI